MYSTLLYACTPGIMLIYETFVIEKLPIRLSVDGDSY